MSVSNFPSDKNNDEAGPLHVLGLIVFILFLLSTSIFVVKETQQVMVVRFGSPVSQIDKPGLHFKLSILDDLRVFEKRILNVDPPAEEVTLADQKRLVVDVFARYRIVNMLTFFQSLGSESAAEQRIATIINAAARGNLGRITMRDLLSDKRDSLMNSIQDDVNTELRRLGLQVVDVRIVRADLPEQVTQATFDRMRSEREREAREARAEGEQMALEIRSVADKDRTIILSEAQRDAQKIRGEGDQTAIATYAKAFNQDPQFFSFYRSLEAYRSSLANPETTLLISPDSEFFRFFKQDLN
jgi:modulator of FtsH protease HflC